MKTQYRIFFMFFTVVLLCHSGIAQYSIYHSTFGSGGGMVSGENTTGTVTVGQLIIGSSQNDSNTVYAGLWYTAYTPVVTSVDLTDDNRMPFEYRLEQNYPNPFNPSTVIQFSVPEQTHVTLTVYDLLGRKVMNLVDSDFSAGNYSVTFDASGLSSGVYIYRLEAGSYISTKRFVYTK